MNDNTSDKNGMNPERPMFPISAIADILNINQRKLRIYDDENILIPSRTTKNTRLYSLNDLERGKFIQYLASELGINLIGIKIIFFLLEQQKISPDKYLEYVSKAAQAVNIDPKQ